MGDEHEARVGGTGSGGAVHALTSRNERSLDAQLPVRRFSVVVPLHNKQRHVAACLQSIMSQSISPAEILVVNDASTDGSLAIVSAYQHPALKILSRSVRGPGGYAARNAGVEAASSNWIAFLDADDTWETSHLERLSAAIDASAEPPGAVFSAAWMVDRTGRRRYPQASHILASRSALTIDLVLEAWLSARDCPLWTGAVAVRRDILLRAGLFPAGAAARGGDKDLWLRVCAITTCAYSAAPTANFFQTADNRVSDYTSHLELPIILQTIATLIPTVRGVRRARLEALANREVSRYAKRNVAAGVRISPQFFKALYLPRGLGRLAYMIALLAIPPWLARRIARRGVPTPGPR